MNPRDRGWWRRPPETAIEHYGKLAEKARLRLGERPSLLADPPQRGDGRCVNLPQKPPRDRSQNGDPFCSTRCACTWHDQLASIGG
jgi:hypothetical protein